jgi:hypothetical protein
LAVFRQQKLVARESERGPKKADNGRQLQCWWFQKITPSPDDLLGVINLSGDVQILDRSSEKADNFESLFGKVLGPEV